MTFEETQARGVAAPSDLTQVVRNESAFVMRTVRRMGVTEADVSDATQEVFLVLHKRAHAWDRTLPVRAWLAAIARKVVKNRLRKAHVRHEVGSFDLDDLAASHDAVDVVLQTKRDRELLASSLDRLDTDKREALVLYYVEGLSIIEIARLLGCPVQTAYSRLRAGRALVERLIVRNRSGVARASEAICS